MRHNWHRLVVGLGVSLVALACSSESPTSPDSNRTVTLAPGQAVAVQGSGLVFQHVTGDSRCPQDVDCVWAGDARVVFRWRGQAVELHTGEEPRSARLGEATVELLDLAPQPLAEQPIPAEAYRATLRVTAD